jgi:hypothetical protein
MLAEKTIRKHVTIIHAYSLMSTLQRKIVNVLLYEAIQGKRLNHHNSVAVECQIPFATLCKAIRFNSNNTQYLKEAIDGLASIKIEWNLLKDRVPTNISFLNLRVLHGAPTFYQDNTLNFSFHKIMLDLVDNPSIYGTLDIDLQSKFESKYGHALYENSTRFINLQKNKIIDLETFRKILGVHEQKYSTMRELTRNVIAPSIEEVNDLANFVVSLDAIKKGRKVTGFEVSVKNRKKVSITKITSEINNHEKILNQIKNVFGEVNQSVLENILNNYSEEYIFEKIEYTRQYAKKAPNGLYPIPYFISAIKYDYKFKEEIKSQTIEIKSVDNNNDWEDQLKSLQCDLAHWQKLLVYATASKNDSQIDNIKKVLLTCQKKIDEHHSKRVFQGETV